MLRMGDILQLEQDVELYLDNCEYGQASPRRQIESERSSPPEGGEERDP